MQLRQNLAVSSDDEDQSPSDLWNRLEGLDSYEPPIRATTEPDSTLGDASEGVADSTPEAGRAGADGVPRPGSYRVGAPEAGTGSGGSVVGAGPAAARGRSAGSPAPARAPVAPKAARAAPTVAPGRSRARRRWYRPKLRWLTLYLPLLVVAALIGGVLYGWSLFAGIERVDLDGALQPVVGDAQNILIVGSDSRDVVTADTPNVAAMGDEGVSGERSDTVIVLRLDGAKASMMSIPRDLWVRNAATGRDGRVNAAYNDGPANLVRTITESLGIPINRYLEVDFVSFSGIVDALGGIEVTFPHTAFDRNSGLLVDQGAQVLDGPAALAYVRSRHYTEVIDGREVTDPTGDLGRQLRQQAFIRTVFTSVGSARNPWTLAKVGRATASGARIDDQWGLVDAVRIARRLLGVDLESVVLPTTSARRGNAAVLLLAEPQADEVLVAFGAQR